MTWQEDLMSWFQRAGRDLPWRRDPTPYRVWLSEVMLQQTQVDRVVAYFERWLEALPTLEAVAQADEETLLRLWRGLGYYSRVRNFHRAARMVVREHGGRLPRDRAGLLALPGIGPYTASAILAFAFNEPHPTIEANTERVYARLFDVAAPIKSSQVQKRMAEHLSQLIPKGRARLFDTALMELGSLVCTPTAPKCDRCPVAHICSARKRGTVSKRPALPERPERVRVRAVALVLSSAARDGRQAVWLRRRPASGLWRGFWELPWEVLPADLDPTEAAGMLLAALAAGEPAPPSARASAPQPSLKALGAVRGSFTNHQLTMACFSAQTPPGRPAPPPAWAAEDLPAGRIPARHAPLEPVALEDALNLPLPAFHLRALRLFVRARRSADTHP